jgi:hypothetical protein
LRRRLDRLILAIDVCPRAFHGNASLQSLACCPFEADGTRGKGYVAFLLIDSKGASDGV